MGTTERLTDTSQNTTDTRQYDAFGLLTSSSGSTPTPFGFAGAWGYQEDSDSGLKLLGHRYYDPSTGRFLTRDPIKDGRNWYSYCEGNPVAGVDDCGQQVRRITLQETGRLRDGMKLYMYHEGVTYLSLPVVVNSGIGGAMWKWKELHLSPSLLVEPPDWSRETGSLRKKLQLSDFEDKAWLASIIAHEMDHVHHNETNFVWSWNQRKVERRAWNKQIEFLETLRDSYQDDPDRVRRINNLIERAHDGLRTNG
ncbi:conserved hypothetical protein [Candidatus Nitrosymbiomonas proteolyticus]|uniref:RHS repeat-associated core domain-containing protein n=1 Tax=Candidatus Nitrosymbiomonas proteolyticus TaxID=2608984 RepID=A0A809R9U6_9BACT|nr:conserved hypothetical protein [Candidatus Nitrosymbiomonas proteolyticus]